MHRDQVLGVIAVWVSSLRALRSLSHCLLMVFIVVVITGVLIVVLTDVLTAVLDVIALASTDFAIHCQNVLVLPSMCYGGVQ